MARSLEHAAPEPAVLVPAGDCADGVRAAVPDHGLGGGRPAERAGGGGAGQPADASDHSLEVS